MRDSSLRVSVEVDMFKRRKAGEQTFAQCLDALGVARELRVGDSTRRAEADDLVGGKSPGANPALLSPAEQDGCEPDTWSTSDVEGTTPLRAIELVRRERQQVDVQGADIHRDLANTLRRVDMQQHFALPTRS